jgi:hypothetical protein
MVAVDPATGGEVAAWCGVIVAVLAVLATVFTPILSAIFRRLGRIQDQLVKTKIREELRDERFRGLPCQRGEVVCPPKEGIIAKSP